MRFTDIILSALATASADPRTLPGSVPEQQILQTPPTLPGTDNAPAYIALVLEGTATQTLDVTVWAQAERAENFAFDAPELAANRLFYKVGVTTTLTVGTMKTIPAPPGKYYLQTGTGPAAASVLRVAYLPVAIP
jgi:hypothetical protein